MSTRPVASIVDDKTLDYMDANTSCTQCGGSGEVDSGGIHPWGEPAVIPCKCETEKEISRQKP